MKKYKEPTNFEFGFGLALEKIATNYYNSWNNYPTQKDDFSIGYDLGTFNAFGEVLGFPFDVLQSIIKQQSDLAQLCQ